MYVCDEINTGSMYVERALIKLSKNVFRFLGKCEDFHRLEVETISQWRWNLAEPHRTEEI